MGKKRRLVESSEDQSFGIRVTYLTAEQRAKLQPVVEKQVRYQRQKERKREEALREKKEVSCGGKESHKAEASGTSQSGGDNTSAKAGAANPDGDQSTTT